MRLKFAPARDVILFVTGLALLGYETLGTPEPRIVLITIAAAMIGLPATFLADRRFVGPSEPAPPSTDTTQEPTP